ncbi:biotin carboxyl carrier domain-containing protein [Agrobacterium rubi]|uniref:Biotin carboxyl carrier domain-containing protein n=1 Tax=Agrobacterium rubi TaxID=28099 RepID=A0AAE7R800_9HYPH|nr:biotin carboxyl carrier domain-containing protein [Agrobacterium rubi]NTF05284.1 biotin carboxyl carrier domain-containing protein [Agrobacterium rubi]NTF10542.1 biotin carboxyl carrier domain-containing protein [Agrobacterium rubi]NTF22936.1 biotin carboxyl carrier domain-containing protein [Agrobacterium rubi]NTF29867.1 biotin carboxyl carrier domain-containing protein [Agrobacterium rubi]
MKTVLAPLPGTFYQKPVEDHPNFKSEADKVALGDAIGLIEVMKSFTSVNATDAGTFVRYLIDNEDAVMAGDAICEIDTGDKE